jgi:hypothetical protein
MNKGRIILKWQKEAALEGIVSFSGQKPFLPSKGVLRGLKRGNLGLKNIIKPFFLAWKGN